MLKLILLSEYKTVFIREVFCYYDDYVVIQNDGSRFFAINPTTGVLTVKETLDYEGLSNLNKLYSIQVQATVSQTNFTNIL